MSWLAIDHKFPTGKSGRSLLSMSRPGTQTGCLGAHPPDEVEVRHPDEIRTIFDAISFMRKGASVLLMLHDLSGS